MPDPIRDDPTVQFYRDELIEAGADPDAVDRLIAKVRTVCSRIAAPAALRPAESSS